jgi:uncharacterized protein with HEPN domain
MSERGGQREWRFYIEDMRRFATKVVSYAEGMGAAEFVGNEMVYDAVLRNLELIGEAANHVPVEVRERHPDVPWRQVVAMRNRLVHAYLGIDPDTVWSTVQDSVPELLSQLDRLRQQESWPNEG